MLANITTEIPLLDTTAVEASWHFTQWLFGSLFHLQIHPGPGGGVGGGNKRSELEIYCVILQHQCILSSKGD